MQVHTTRSSTTHDTRWRRLARRATAVAIALTTIAGFNDAGMLMASGDDGPHDGPRGCTLTTLKGRYLFAASGILVPPAFGVTQPTPAADAGFHLFNGDGTGVDIVTVRIGTAVALENFITPITYTVNPDCTGSYEVPNGPTFGLFISPDGEELARIATGPAGNYPSSIDRRVSRR